MAQPLPWLSERNAPGRLPYPVELSGARKAANDVLVVREPAVFRRGEGLYKFYREPIIVDWPATPPPGFLNGNNSVSEWWCYVAYSRILGPEGRLWGYQVPAAGGRKIPGGAVVDFVLNLGTRYAVRVQTIRFHIAVPQWKQEYDRQQRRTLEDAGFRVIDLWEPRFIFDRTGRATMYVCRLSTNGIELPPPFGTMGNGVRAA